jgi:hypothetical protein
MCNDFPVRNRLALLPVSGIIRGISATCAVLPITLQRPENRMCTGLALEMKFALGDSGENRVNGISSIGAARVSAGAVSIIGTGRRGGVDWSSSRGSPRPPAGSSQAAGAVSRRREGRGAPDLVEGRLRAPPRVPGAVAGRREGLCFGVEYSPQ